MGCKSGIYAVNTTQGTAVANGGTLPLGNIIRRYGQNITLGGNGLSLTGGGYYDVDATVTVTATAAGPAFLSSAAMDKPLRFATSSMFLTIISVFKLFSFLSCVILCLEV